MSELILTEEEEREVQEGEAAGLLLDSPSFLLAIERIRRDCAEGILTSPPGQPQVREDLYNLSRGLSAVTEQLKIMEARSVSLVENAKLKTPTADDEVQEEAPDFGDDY
jgi:hypothetical protein